MSADKEKAQRLAAALRRDQQGIALGAEGMGWSPSDQVREQAAALLERWPDGEPVGKVLTEAEMGIGWDGRAGNILWWRKPDAPALLYTAQPVKPDGEPVACPGRPDSRCNYDAHCGRVCNKCGRIHDGYANPNGTITSRGHTAPPADAARIAALEAALAERDRVIEQARVELEAILRHFTKVPSTLADSKACGGVHDGLQIEGIQR